MQLNPDGIVGPMTWQALYDVYLGADHNVPVLVLMNLNGLTSDLLMIGQVLKVRVL